MMKVLLGRCTIELLLYHKRRFKIYSGCIHTDENSVLKCSEKQDCTYIQIRLNCYLDLDF